MTGAVWIGEMRACAACFDADHVREHGHPGLCHVPGCRTRDGGECAISYAGAEEPMDTKPLRQEDYQAMAERARRAEAELAQLKAKRPVNYKKIAGRVGLALIVVGVIMLGAHLVARAVDHVASEHSRPTAKRTTACYFTDVLDRDVEPWERQWAIIRSNCEGCMNHRVNNAPDRHRWFNSQLEAWNFMIAWRMEPCR